MTYWHIKEREDIWGKPCRYCGKRWKNAAVHLLYTCTGTGRHPLDVPGIDSLNETFTDARVDTTKGQILPGYTAMDLWMLAGSLAAVDKRVWIMAADKDPPAEDWHGVYSKR